MGYLYHPPYAAKLSLPPGQGTYLTMTASSATSKTLLVLETSRPCSPSPVIPSWDGRFRAWWAQAWRDVRADLKATSWGNASLWVISFLSTLLPFSCLLYFFPGMKRLSTYSSWYDDYLGLDVRCLPDGSFSLARSFQYWQISGFFQITLPFPQRLTFTEAKVVDIIWDLVSEQLK